MLTGTSLISEIFIKIYQYVVDRLKAITAVVLLLPQNEEETHPPLGDEHDLLSHS